MDKESRKVIYSEEYAIDLERIFEYGQETFGLSAANSFLSEIYFKTEKLSLHYELYPECRHLPTKSKLYRMLILGSYMIVYRITADKIEVLRAFHSSQSIRSIKSSRKVKP